jgi:glycosyltransferase involved in cell wall biosynthesis
MKIAQIAPLVERVPPKKYGGTERVVHALTEELVKLGHEVTLFASGDSKTSARLVSVYPRALREAKVKNLYTANFLTMLNIGIAYQRQDEFDIIHDHNDFLSLPTANIARRPVVMTMHGPFTAQNRALFQTLNRPYQVTISKSQGYVVPKLHHAGTIYNGLNMESYPFSNEHEGYLLYVGRISLEKGVHYAIDAAMSLDLPLIIAAKLENIDKPYFYEYVEPHLSDQIKWVGEVGQDERNQLMSKAMAFLHPVTWREPFGLTLIEAMACGCPVVAFNKGSIPEIVKSGQTGFVVEDVEGMLDAIQHIGSIDRQVCRNHSLENFNSRKMAEEYEILYKKILDESNNPKAESLAL